MQGQCSYLPADGALLTLLAHCQLAKCQSANCRDSPKFFLGQPIKRSAKTNELRKNAGLALFVCLAQLKIFQDLIKILNADTGLKIEVLSF